MGTVRRPSTGTVYPIGTISPTSPRYQNNIMTYISPSTKRLHDDIVANSPSRVCHHNAESLRASRKNIISIIDYIISIGEIENDPQSAIKFDEMEKNTSKV
jgi:hypothetical protein